MAMRLAGLLGALCAGVAGLSACAGEPPEAAPSGVATSALGARSAAMGGASGDLLLAQAFAERAHHLQVEGRGSVVRLLADDEEGGRHQRFILRLTSGQTLLIAHNIDVAPRARGVRVRDTVAFCGEYEWNELGGTIHWTHRDPGGEHVDGWLKHRGRIYE